MPFYHVRLMQQSTIGPSDEVTLDLTLEQLKQRIVVPYRQGQPITINGKSHTLGDYERVMITKTNREFSNLRARVRLLPTTKTFSNTDFLAQHIERHGEDVTDDFITGPPGSALTGQSADLPEGTLQSREKTSMRIFISHSNKDVNFAKLLIDLLLKSLHLRSEDIRCTSVDGFRLQAGAPIIERLRSEIHDAELLIAIITPNSMKSAYVIFELGARWGTEKPMIPLLASGATPELLEGPLAEINALDARYEGQVYQLVEDASGYLGIALDKTSSYASAVSELVRLSTETEVEVEQQPATNGILNLSDDSNKLLIEATEDQYRGIQKVRTVGGLVIRTNYTEFVEMCNKRSEARWEQALRELVEHGLVTDPTGKDRFFEVTHKGFEFVDRLREAQKIEREER